MKKIVYILTAVLALGAFSAALQKKIETETKE